MMLASIMPSVGNIDEVNNAILREQYQHEVSILHQLSVFTFILTLGNLLRQALIL